MQGRTRLVDMDKTRARITKHSKPSCACHWMIMAITHASLDLLGFAAVDFNLRTLTASVKVHKLQKLLKIMVAHV